MRILNVLHDLSEATLGNSGKINFKMLQASQFLVCFFKRYRSFNAENLGSVGQRGAKLPAIKL